MTDPSNGPQVREEPPPVGRRWGVLYAVVLGALALEILLFWLFARTFR